MLTGDVEYASGFVSMLQARRRLGVEIEVIPDDEHGQVSVEALARRLDDDRAGPVGLVALTHVPTNGGLVNPAEEVGRLTRAAGVPYLLDACQSVGQMPVDVEAIGCDLLAATGRKFLRAPRGTGFLYARRALLDRTDPRRSSRRSSTCWAPTGWRPTGTSCGPTPAGSRTGSATRPRSPACAAAVSYARSWGLDAIGDRVTARRRRPAGPAGGDRPA